MEDFFNKNLEKIELYIVDEYKEDFLRFDMLENPYTLPNNLLEKIQKKIKKFQTNKYPTTALSNQLIEKICKYLRVAYPKITPSWVLLGNGSDELILLILLATNRELSVFLPQPTFPIYQILAKALGYKIILQDLDRNFQIKKLPTSKSICFFAYPNNPTANLFDKEIIISALEGGHFVVVDEAYFEFSEKTTMELLESFDNLVILRTFSKAFSLASVRLGYLISNPKNIEKFLKVKLPFNVNLFALICGIVVMENLNIFKRRIKIIKEQREFLKSQLSKLGFCVFDSLTNFLLVDFGKNKEFFYKKLLENKIVTKSFSHKLLESSLRITIRKPKENKKLLEVLRRIKDNLNPPQNS